MRQWDKQQNIMHSSKDDSLQERYAGLLLLQCWYYCYAFVHKTSSKNTAPFVHVTLLVFAL
jgi:hypothetical protein